MTSFGLLDSVRSALNTPITTPNPSLTSTPVAKSKRADVNMFNVNMSNDNTPVKSINIIETLSYGDKIIDKDGNVRYVISVDTRTRNVLMTGRKRNLSNYGKAFTWSEDKFYLAVSKKGFRLA